MLSLVKKEKYSSEVKKAKKKCKSFFKRRFPWFNCTQSDPVLPPELEKEIFKLRDDMELVWCDETRYHGTIFNDIDKNSKGQCGVSSFYLAKFLEKKNYEVLFCEGDAYFSTYDPILKHCWIKLLNHGKNKDLIIDITADQSGYDQKVVCMTKSELNKYGIHYYPKKEYKTQEIRANSLLKRQEYLESKLKNF